jgi:hypothetical protein
MKHSIRYGWSLHAVELVGWTGHHPESIVNEVGYVKSVREYSGQMIVYELLLPKLVHMWYKMKLRKPIWKTSERGEYAQGSHLDSLGRRVVFLLLGLMVDSFGTVVFGLFMLLAGAIIVFKNPETSPENRSLTTGPSWLRAALELQSAYSRTPTTSSPLPRPQVWSWKGSKSLLELPGDSWEKGEIFW